MNLRATGTRYLIEAEQQNKNTASGIILQHSENTQFGIIRAVGPDVKEPVPVGSKVVVLWNTTVPLKHESEQFFVIESGAVLAVVEEL
jgi:co-chaperonin GroES (HSP10)